MVEKLKNYLDLLQQFFIFISGKNLWCTKMNYKMSTLNKFIYK